MANITFTESSGLQDSVFGKSQAPIRRFIEKRAESFENESIARLLFDMNKSQNYGEKLTGFTAMDDFQAAGEMGAYPATGMQEGYSRLLEHVTFKNSFSVSREIIEDAKVLDLRRKPEAFVTAYYRTRERFAAALIGAALAGNNSVQFAGGEFSTLAADGKNVFSAAHTAKISGLTQANVFANAFSEDALGELEVRMQNTVGDNGEILDIAPDTIVIPNDRATKKAVFAIIGAERDPETSNNGYNYHFGRWNVIVWPYLNQYVTGATIPWILFDSHYNKTVGTNVWFDRVALEVRSGIDENTDANVWRGYARFIAGFNDWRGMFAAGVPGAASL